LLIIDSFLQVNLEEIFHGMLSQRKEELCEVRYEVWVPF